MEGKWYTSRTQLPLHCLRAFLWLFSQLGYFFSSLSINYEEESAEGTLNSQVGISHHNAFIFPYKGDSPETTAFESEKLDGHGPAQPINLCAVRNARRG